MLCFQTIASADMYDFHFRLLTRHDLTSRPRSSILVVKDGRIIEQGSHSELVERGGVFATMWADQIAVAEDMKLTSGSGSKTCEGNGLEKEGEDN
jgi:hypothetical protein